MAKTLREKGVEPHKMVLLSERTPESAKELDRVGIERQISKMLTQRIKLLGNVRGLARTLGIEHFQNYACDSARYLFLN